MNFNDEVINEIHEMMLIFNNSCINNEDLICFSVLENIISEKKQISDFSIEVIETCIKQLVDLKEFFISIGGSDFSFFETCINYFVNIKKKMVL